MSPFTFFTSSLSSCSLNHCIWILFVLIKKKLFVVKSIIDALLSPPHCPPSPSSYPAPGLHHPGFCFDRFNEMSSLFPWLTSWLWMKYSSCCDFSIQQPKSIWCCCGNAYRLFPVAVLTCPRHRHHCQDTYSPLSSCPNIPDREQEETHFPQLSEG